MTRFYIVRHGKSEYNLAHIITGQIDVALTDTGILQAEQARIYYKRIKLDAAYSSDLKRAYKTASIILEGKDLKIHRSKKLRERTYGSLEGMPSKEFREKGYFTCDIREFGGENEEDTGKRAVKELTRIGEKEGDRKVFIACHETFIICLLRELDKERFGNVHDGDRFIRNCSTTVIDYRKGTFKIMKVSDNSYIDEELR